MGESGTPLLKKGHFPPENGLKMPILRQKQFLLGSGGQFKAPPPILQVVNSKTNMLQG